MNYWTNLSIKYANQKNYLDELFKVYPTIPEGIRDVDENLWNKIEIAYTNKDNENLLKYLLKMDLFPIKDSYVAYLKRDKESVNRNPETVNRLCGRLYEMGLDKIFEKCSEPKETNRQIGPLFKRWLKKRTLGVPLMSLEEFESTDINAVLFEHDDKSAAFAKKFLGYNHNKGLDFVARFNNRYVIGEAKFLTDFGGHQTAQFNDAIQTIEAPLNSDVVPIAILDGVLYIEGNNKIRNYINQSDYNIMSALVLREFLYQI